MVRFLPHRRRTRWRCDRKSRSPKTSCFDVACLRVPLSQWSQGVIGQRHAHRASGQTRRCKPLFGKTLVQVAQKYKDSDLLRLG